MKTFEEFKSICEDSDRFKKLSKEKQKQYRIEIYRAKIAYENEISLYEKFLEKKESVKKQYVIPFLLGITDEILDEELSLVQVRKGSSGGKIYATHYRNVV